MGGNVYFTCVYLLIGQFAYPFVLPLALQKATAYADDQQLPCTSFCTGLSRNFMIQSRVQCVQWPRRSMWECKNWFDQNNKWLLACFIIFYFLFNLHISNIMSYALKDIWYFINLNSNMCLWNTNAPHDVKVKNGLELDPLTCRATVNIHILIWISVLNLKSMRL